MNERIKDLADQAMKYAAEQYGLQRRGEQVWNPYLYDQKIVELVVQECIKVLDESDGSIYHGELLKEHFGVKS